MKPAANPLWALLETGRRELAYVEAGPPDSPSRTPKPPVASGTVNLKDLISLADPAGAGGVYSLNSRPAGSSAPLEPAAVIAEHSRTVAAGSRLIIAAPRDRAIEIDGGRTSGLMGFYRDTGLIRAIDPAPFAAVADGADVATAAWPLFDATLSWPDAPSAAFSTTISRAQNAAVGGGEFLMDEMLWAILRGLGQLADATLLAAIAAATPAAFTLSAAAAKALLFDDLRALVGTSGTGASVNAAGQLIAGPGIRAELTAAASGTYVGAFGRAAVAIWPELQVHVVRARLDGSVQLVVFASVQACLPDPASFWAVTA